VCCMFVCLYVFVRTHSDHGRVEPGFHCSAASRELNGAVPPQQNAAAAPPLQATAALAAPPVAVAVAVAAAKAPDSDARKALEELCQSTLVELRSAQASLVQADASSRARRNGVARSCVLHTLQVGTRLHGQVAGYVVWKLIDIYSNNSMEVKVEKRMRPVLPTRVGCWRSKNRARHSHAATLNSSAETSISS
jgi:hypothetical protein